MNNMPLDGLNRALSKNQFLVPLDKAVFSELWQVLQFYFYMLEVEEPKMTDTTE